MREDNRRNKRDERRQQKKQEELRGMREGSRKEREDCWEADDQRARERKGE